MRGCGGDKVNPQPSTLNLKNLTNLTNLINLKGLWDMIVWLRKNANIRTDLEEWKTS